MCYEDEDKGICETSRSIRSDSTKYGEIRTNSSYETSLWSQILHREEYTGSNILGNSIKRESRYGYVYVTENIINHHGYIGMHKSKDFDESYKGSGTALNLAIKKYGWDNFKTYIIQWCRSFEELCECERFWIKETDAVNSPIFYNIANGGFGGDVIHNLPEDRQKEIYSKLSKNRVGVKRPDWVCENISKKLTGRKFSEEHRKHLSESLSIAMLGDKNPFYGKHHSDKTKQVLRNNSKRVLEYNPELVKVYSLNGYKNNVPTKPVIAYSLETGEEYVFDSIGNAARFLGTGTSNIVHCCKNEYAKKGNVYKGYEWYYCVDKEVIADMKRMNQYSIQIDDYNREHGTDIFAEYKLEHTTSERKQEIEDFLFKIIREKNEIPITILNENESTQSLISFSEIDPYSVYKDGDYGFNANGVSFLNQFFPEIMDVEKKGMPTIRQGFSDDTRLKRAIKKSLLYSSNELGIFRWLIIGSGCGYCTNFRPASAKALYEIFGKERGCKVFDSSAGYGARMLGAHFASNVTEYLGIDPNTADHCQDEIKYLDERFNTGTKKTVLKMGSEDFTPENFPQYQNYFDLYFTSPPYFDTERYSQDETQSYKKFPTYAGWIKGFYQQTIYNACDALKSDGVFAINIFEKVPNIKELTKLFLANKGFYVYKTDRYLLKSMPGGHKDENGNMVVRDRSVGSNFEPVFMAKHYSRLYKEGLISYEKALECQKRATLDTKNVILEEM